MAVVSCGFMSSACASACVSENASLLENANPNQSACAGDSGFPACGNVLGRSPAFAFNPEKEMVSKRCID